MAYNLLWPFNRLAVLHLLWPFTLALALTLHLHSCGTSPTMILYYSHCSTSPSVTLRPHCGTQVTMTLPHPHLSTLPSVVFHLITVLSSQWLFTLLCYQSTVTFHPHWGIPPTVTLHPLNGTPPTMTSHSLMAQTLCGPASWLCGLSAYKFLYSVSLLLAGLPGTLQRMCPASAFLCSLPGHKHKIPFLIFLLYHHHNLSLFKLCLPLCSWLSPQSSAS